jgi:hypothetical protein
VESVRRPGRRSVANIRVIREWRSAGSACMPRRWPAAM